MPADEPEGLDEFSLLAWRERVLPSGDHGGDHTRIRRFDRIVVLEVLIRRDHRDRHRPFRAVLVAERSRTPPGQRWLGGLGILQERQGHVRAAARE
jgi:hypothetical protein